MVRHYYLLLKISEDTFCEVDESANNKEIPMAGREAAKNKSVSATHIVVVLKMGPHSQPSLEALYAWLPSALTTQTFFVIGFFCCPEVSTIISHKSQSDTKANAKVHADLLELIFNYHDSLYSKCLLSNEHCHANSGGLMGS